MDGNKNEAQNCIRRAQNCIEDDPERAETLLKKAQRLHPSKEAQDLLEVTKRKKEVKRINRCNSWDYYKILDVGRNVTKPALGRKFRKLSLLVHPDKNQGCEEATKAFKTLKKAHDALTNPVAIITNFGGNDRNNEDFNSANENNTNNREDPFGRYFRARGGYWRFETRQENNFTFSSFIVYFKYYAPLIACVIYLALNVHTSMVGSPYSLIKTSDYSIERKSPILKIPYFVKKDYFKLPEATREAMRKSLEEAYMSDVKILCDEEKTKRDTMMWKARNFGDRQQFQKAHYMEMPDCDLFAKLEQMYLKMTK